MIFDTIVVGPLQVNCYIVGCEKTHLGMVIDPGDDADLILESLRLHDLNVVRILATHGHFDHVMAVRSLQEATHAPFYLHPADLPLLQAMRRTASSWLGTDPGEPPTHVETLMEGTTISVGAEAFEVRATPGHSPGSVSLVSHTNECVFTGDALFAGSIGRTDLHGGDMRLLLSSIESQILSLPGSFDVLPGHGPASRVEYERRSNPFLGSAGMRLSR